jgi:hypothetical protein
LRPENVKLWEIRDLGKISKIRPPRIKEKIRKFGARTGPTSGTIKGIANIRVEGYLYNGVYVTSGGFGCPGDSGASVLSERNELLGIYSWGEDKPCEQNPKGYLWVLANSKRGMGEISIQEY